MNTQPVKEVGSVESKETSTERETKSDSGEPPELLLMELEGEGFQTQGSEGDITVVKSRGRDPKAASWKKLRASSLGDLNGKDIRDWARNEGAKRKGKEKSDREQKVRVVSQGKKEESVEEMISQGFKKVLDKLDEEKKERKNQFDELKREFVKMEKKNQELDRREAEEKWMEEEERKKRSKNLVIIGWDKGENTGKEEVAKFFREELGVESEIEDIEGVKNIGKEGKKMTWVRMKMGAGKREIIEKKRRLKGKKIFIENDRTRKERNAQKELHRRAWIARNKEEVKEVKVGFRKLWLDGVLWCSRIYGLGAI
ncbi:Protein of unknown function [Cotesia congregata]|uniref:Uncharacterized protein n=1 Tax=Cotesia congregata TaxID=51543 RepID=A0A8J2MPW9_COTCN|nr:Protein of unknown function [Cotesia congregata]